MRTSVSLLSLSCIEGSFLDVISIQVLCILHRYLFGFRAPAKYIQTISRVGRVIVSTAFLQEN